MEPAGKPAPVILAGRAVRTKARVEAETDISRYAIGAEWDKLKPGEQSAKYFSLVKPALNAPCPTATASGGGGSIASIVHPTERRKFTIAELKRICAFPDDYVLTGSYADQWARCGNAVPPVMMYHIAKVLVPVLTTERMERADAA
jgi:DNA (cytosine-5)-methyltransferase 1